MKESLPNFRKQSSERESMYASSCNRKWQDFLNSCHGTRYQPPRPHVGDKAQSQENGQILRGLVPLTLLVSTAIHIPSTVDAWLTEVQRHNCTLKRCFGGMLTSCPLIREAGRRRSSPAYGRLQVSHSFENTMEVYRANFDRMSQHSSCCSRQRTKRHSFVSFSSS